MKSFVNFVAASRLEFKRKLLTLWELDQKPASASGALSVGKQTNERKKSEFLKTMMLSQL